MKGGGQGTGSSIQGSVQGGAVEAQTQGCSGTQCGGQGGTGEGMKGRREEKEEELKNEGEEEEDTYTSFPLTGIHSNPVYTLCFVPPTAMALLNADASDITVFPGRSDDNYCSAKTGYISLT